jgi:NitT/TauT family transport system substrate-binding protein
MKKCLCVLLCAALLLTGLSACGKKADDSQSTAASSSASSASASSAGDASQPASDETALGYTLPNFTVLSGPTGIGAAKLLSDDAEAGAALDARNVVDKVSIESDNQAVVNALINGDTDIAAVATNVAANLFAKTDGAVQVLAVNTLGVLYILEKGDTVHSLSDLRGKTLYATGQGANPEYVLNYLLEQNDVSPEQVDIQWMTAQEVTANMTSQSDGICMLPVPAATALQLQDSDVRQAISLSEQWDKLDRGALAMGCIVARTDYVEENPQGVEAFLSAYEQSIAVISDEGNLDEAAQLVADYGITANAKVAAAAIPQCNLTFLTGDEMWEVLEQYYQVLYQADPSSIGGAMPYDSFYYGVG